MTNEDQAAVLMHRRIDGWKREYLYWYAIGGGLINAASAISLIEKIFSVGLAPVFQEFINYYRKVAYFFLDPIFSLLPLYVSSSYKDLYLVSLISLAMLLRSGEVAYADRVHRQYPRLSAGLNKRPAARAAFLLIEFLLALLANLSLVGLVLPFVIVRVHLTMRDHIHRLYRDAQAVGRFRAQHGEPSHSVLAAKKEALKVTRLQIAKSQDAVNLAFYYYIATATMVFAVFVLFAINSQM